MAVSVLILMGTVTPKNVGKKVKLRKVVLHVYPFSWIVADVNIWAESVCPFHTEAVKCNTKSPHLL